MKKAENFLRVLRSKYVRKLLFALLIFGACIYSASAFGQSVGRIDSLKSENRRLINEVVRNQQRLLEVEDQLEDTSERLNSEMTINKYNAYLLIEMEAEKAREMNAARQRYRELLLKYRSLEQENVSLIVDIQRLESEREVLRHRISELEIQNVAIELEKERLRESLDSTTFLLEDSRINAYRNGFGVYVYDSKLGADALLTRVFDRSKVKRRYFRKADNVLVVMPNAEENGLRCELEYQIRYRKGSCPSKPEVFEWSESIWLKGSKDKMKLRLLAQVPAKDASLNTERPSAEKFIKGRYVLAYQFHVYSVDSGITSFKYSSDVQSICFTVD